MSDLCPICKKSFGSRRKKILDGTLKAQGRPLKTDQSLVVALRKKGLSISEISKLVNVSRGAIQYALRPKP